jgi:hypothetical protein
MESNKIEAVLEKYFRGISTIAEEKELKMYFSSGKVAEHLVVYQPLFDYFAKEKQNHLSNTIKLPGKEKKYLSFISIAATAVVLLGISFYFFTTSEAPVKGDYGTFENPEIAFKETQKALDLISTNLNAGMESIGYLNEFEQSKNLIFQ